ncbi:g-patch domain protein [Oesophagostomum dentatum]|uniref:Splicing factor 45 n=2 Tax=Oesophagostomum dentatum TaxID=61180 RepID=A0A0B1SI04_OESDE|nr:g-patch domain protein [Oesophagostomum dentatum]
MKFLQAQIAQKRVQIQQGMQKTSIAPVVDLSARNKAALNMRRIQPVRALPITDCAPPSFLPKGAVEDSVNLFGEYVVKNEYQPAVPNEYIAFKRKAEEREAREKHAREIAERLSRDHKEEAKKRVKGAAIAPPQALLEQPSSPPKVNLFGEYVVKNEYQPAVPNEYIAFKRKAEEREAREKHAREIAERLSRDHKEEAKKRVKGAAIAPPQALLEQPSSPPKQSSPPSSTSMPPPAFLPSFGKATSKGLGVAANIMSKFGYKHGAGLGRDEQGMSTALSVEKLGKNAGLIINESQATPSHTTTAAPMGVSPINMTEAMKRSTKVLMLTNMVGPDEIDDELEPEIREEMAKYGQVASVDGVNDELAVRIFVEFTNVAQAIKAFVVMNGRFFGGRSVAASFYNVDDFNSKEYGR